MDLEYTKSGLTELYDKAVDHFEDADKITCKYLYRNKPANYFENIINYKDGIMNPYLKANGNDLLNPMNERLRGLFFMASMKNYSDDWEVTGSSPFGDTRLMVPVENLMEDVNLYFADFFCLQSHRHHVTLVACEDQSETDHFCNRKLIKISFRKNIFFSRSKNNKYRVADDVDLDVQIFYTQPLDLKEEMRVYPHTRTSFIIYGVPTAHNGSYRTNVVEKNQRCSVCNIQHNDYDFVKPRTGYDEVYEYQKCKYKKRNKFDFNTPGKYVHNPFQTNRENWLAYENERPMRNLKEMNVLGIQRTIQKFYDMVL